MENVLAVLLFLADVDRRSFERAPRNEKNYIIFTAIAIIVATALTGVSVFYFVWMLFQLWLMALGMGIAAGGMVYFFHRTILRDSNRKKLYFMIAVALIDGALIALPLKIALMKPFLEKEIIAETKVYNDNLYNDVVLELDREFFEKREQAREDIELAGKVYDERGSKGVQEIIEARRTEDMILEKMEKDLAAANQRYENLKKEADTSFTGLLTHFLGSMFGEGATSAAMFSNLAFLFFFFIFEAAPALIRLTFNEDNSLYLQEIAHKTNMAYKGSRKVQDIDHNIMKMDDLNMVRLAILEKKVWNELTRLMSQDDPDERKLLELQQTIAYIEAQKNQPGPSSSANPGTETEEKNEDEGDDDNAPEFEYNF